MTTDTDPRVAEAMRLCRLALFGSGTSETATFATVETYLAAELAKVPSASDHQIDSACRAWLAATLRGDGTEAAVTAAREQLRVPSAPVEAVSQHPPHVFDAEGDPVFVPLAANTSGKTENEIDRLETEVARLTAELEEARKALLAIATYRPLTFAECSDAEAIIGIAEKAAAAMTKEKP